MTQQVPAALLSDKGPKLVTVLQAALDIALLEGFAAISRSKVADRAGVSRGTVSNTYGGMPALCDMVMKEAIEKGHLKIVAQGLAVRHPIAMCVSDRLKQEAADYLTA